MGGLHSEVGSVPDGPASNGERYAHRYRTVAIELFWVMARP